MIFEKLMLMLKDIMVGYEIDFSKINNDSKLVDDLGMNSISMLLMSISIEDEWGIEITTTDAVAFIRVRDVCEYIENNKKLKS